MDICKAIIPAAGLGTRFLPYTKTIPKEMLPLLNKPAIEYIIQEGLSSDIKHFSLITASGKGVITDYLSATPELERILEDRGQQELISRIQRIIRQASFTYILQTEPLGLGHAIWLARTTIGKEYFGIMLPDDIIISKTAGLTHLIRLARQEKASIVAVQEVPQECVSSYGVISIKKQLTPNLFQVNQLIEKPKAIDAPSNLAIIGRYVLSHKIFQAIEEISTYASDEIQLTDGINHMMHQNEKVFAYKISDTRYDIGTPLGWLKANIGLAMKHPEYAPIIRKYIAELNAPESFVYDNTKNIMHTI